MHPMGRLLEQGGIVTKDDIELAAATGGDGAAFFSALVRIGAISETDLLSALSNALTLTIIDSGALPSAQDVGAAAAALNVPVSWFADQNVIAWRPLDTEDARLCVAGPFIFEPAIQEAAEQWEPRGAQLFLAPSQTVAAILAELSGQNDGKSGENTSAQLREMAEAAPAIDFVADMLASAVARRASDIHIEPFEFEMQVRFRIDGILKEWRTVPRRLYDAISSRLKLMSAMDIAERRLPQDGRQRFRISAQDYDVRVSTLPTTWGESIVLRFLGRIHALPDFREIGFEPDHEALVRRLIGKANGLVLVTGPTGSGKTTTVYRLVSELNDGVRKIVTVEDPVELNLPGVLQMHVRSDIGLDFAAGLRSILRQDPDIIMVGEIRDGETARIAVQAALTGHLVVSTVHTNSAIAAISRMADLGIEDYLLADVLRGVIGQRLLRLSCGYCGGAKEMDARQGCEQCGFTGYSGRIAVFEAAEIGADLQAGIRRRANEKEFEAIARAAGFRSMYEDALIKVKAGLTTPQEALRVFGDEP